ncbi:unnamed protein product [Rotaria sordida]|uniref:Uncharacterized protein n=2 Tax=Rotaria sordida TaxID=392033 RepID=A0A818MWF2_9BILA|nr:unnamed protein product [Rotaria sordida]CAF3596369.1 unnamed protein product [Rotaria sordida]
MVGFNRIPIDAYPDLDLTHFGEERTGFYDIIAASSLPVMIDADDCYDQQAPKRCDHLKGKQLVSVNAMVSKIRAALAARSESEFFIVARTDAIEAYILDEALHHGTSPCVNIFEGGGHIPWVSPNELYKMGFSMILYLTIILFRVTYAIEQAIRDLIGGKQLSLKDSVNFQIYEDIVGLSPWKEIEKKFHHED